MRLVVVLVLAALLGNVCLSWAQTIDATTAPQYPLELADRPLLMFGGMTSIDFGIDIPSVDRPIVDSMGNEMTRRERLFIPSLVARHSFGSVEISAATDFTPGGDFYIVGADFSVGALPGIVYASLSYETEEDLIFNVDEEEGHVFGQRIGYNYKAFLVPKRFSVGAGASVSLAEVSSTSAMGSSMYETRASASAGVGPQLQLTRRLAAYGAASVAVPVRGGGDTTLFAQAGLVAALKHWDFYGRFALQDVTDTRRPLIAFGVVYRFGM